MIKYKGIFSKVCVSLVIYIMCLTVLVPVAQAATLADIKILSAEKASNDSGTTNESPYQFESGVTFYPINFTLSGDRLINLDVLPGTQQAVLVLPKNLEEFIVPTGEAQGSVDVLLNPTGTVGALFDTLIDLLSNLISVLGGILGLLSSTLRNLLQDLSNSLDRLKNLGQVTFTTPITSNGQVLVADYDASLSDAIISEVLLVLNDIENNVKRLQQEGGLVGATIGSLLGPILNAVTDLVEVLQNPTTQTVDELLNGAVLSDFSIVFPTQFNKPTSLDFGQVDTGVIEAQFLMTLIKTEVLDINLLISEPGNTSVYYQGLVPEKNTNLLLPKNLDFGSHVIQTRKDETFIASEEINNEPIQTQANIEFENTLPGIKNWEIKVKQDTEWLNNLQNLEQAQVKLYGGNLTTKGFNSSDIDYNLNDVPLTLEPFQEKQLIRLNDTESQGELSFAIDKFEMFIPKNINKLQGEYQSTFIWTVSESP